eukprot:TRINITY_DN32650_c0_g2_i1.p1 TRINITY_DN32650_c0_g2~~TRINITY_DN32650_c0_g2_i1.p1  ORF type:complete len:334 (+),score=72.22 TRINITY_DN32650_c0_g2_i1:226-1227(+)
MGCGVSTVAEDTASNYGPDGQRWCEWWVAGEATPGCVTIGGETVPDGGPFNPAVTSPTKLAGSVLFSRGKLERDGSGSEPQTTFSYSDPIYARAFFSHALPCYSVGWALLELSKERPHYNTKKIKEKEQLLLRQGKELDYSRRRRYYIFPENIKEIGIMLYVNGKPVADEIAVSSDSWDCEPIEDSFFTFTPDRGSVFGPSTGGPETSLPIHIRPSKNEEEIYRDPRWSRLHVELLKVLQKQGEGTTSLRWEVVYRYGNWKFVAWNAEEAAASGGKAPAYRYSDEDRDREEDVSVPIAKGEFKISVSREEVQQLAADITKLQQVHKAAKERIS